MADCPTYKDLWRIARNEVLANNASLTRSAIERSGSDAGALVAASAAVGDAVIGRAIQFQASLLLGSARGAALDKLVWDRYQELRRQAAPGRVDVTITSPTAVATGFLIPAGTVFTTADGRVWNATEQVSFPTGATGPITVPTQSALSGLAQQIRRGAINAMQLTTAPAGLVVTNPLASAGADDGEDDDTFRARAQRIYATRSRGTLAAIERGALSVGGVRTARAFEYVDVAGTLTPTYRTNGTAALAFGARLVEVVISDQFTAELVDAGAVPAAYQAQALTLANQVRSALLEYRACGVQVVVTQAIVSLIGITLLLRFRAGVDVAATSAAARAVAVSYTNGLRGGDTWEPQVLEALLAQVPGLEVLGGEVAAPSLPQPAESLQCWRTGYDLVVVGNV